MASGDTARNPETPYLVYAFEWRKKVYYIGIGQEGKVRHTDRWKHVARLRRRQLNGSITENGLADLNKTSNAVIAAMQRLDLEEHEVRILWSGKGRAAALLKEKAFIKNAIERGCALTNIQHGSGNTVDDVLAYLGVLENM